MHARLPALSSLQAHSAFAISPFPVDSTMCKACADAAWRTDVAGTSHGSDGRIADYGSGTARDSTLLTDHERTITGLLPSAIQRLRTVLAHCVRDSVRSRDVTGLKHMVYRACGHCSSPRSFTKIADNECSDRRGRWRGAGHSCYTVAALANCQSCDPIQITVSAFSSGHSGRLRGRFHQ